MKKLLCTMIAVLMTATMLGCGGSAETTEAPVETEAVEETAEAETS